mgnify:CR=1 FL=1|uniref:Chemotaxis protein CheA n=1 Tax=candidate division WOR-3 bacterium TaxID=2052148 RepID=A0A7C3NA63_UNCW3
MTNYEELFISEAEEYLEQVSDSILKLEKDMNDIEAINSIFRGMHTIKGMAASMGYSSITKISHSIEDVMDLIRSEKLQVSSELVDLLLKGTDYIQSLVHKSQIDENIIKSFLKVIESIKTGSETVKEKNIVEERKEKKEPEKFSLSEKVIKIIFADDVVLKSARAFVVIKNLQDKKLYIKSDPDFDSIMKENFKDEIKIFIKDTPQINSIIEEIKGIPEIKDAFVLKEEIKNEQETVIEKKDIKVSLERLDNLQNYASELVIARGRLQQIAYSLQNEELINSLNSTSKIISNIQDEIMKIRMVPVGQVFDRYPRYIRDLSNRLKKKINFIIKGKDIELDRAILNSLADPLLHLLKNAVDHGIESPEERLKNKKDETGNIILEAKRVKNGVLIIVSDDGKGLDKNKIIEKALSLNLVDEEKVQHLSENDIYSFITSEGFSTKEEVNDISGRGVGVGAVYNVLKQIGGTLEISSQKNKGTTFTLKLPLTLAIIKTLIVKVSDETYIIPLSHIVETIDIKKEDIFTIMGKEVFVLRDEVIPLVRLSNIFKCENTGEREKYSIVLVEVDESFYGILVDSFMEQSEVVVKPLKGILSGIHGLAGVSILNNGMPSFIVDVPGVVSMAKEG